MKIPKPKPVGWEKRLTGFLQGEEMFTDHRCHEDIVDFFRQELSRREREVREVIVEKLNNVKPIKYYDEFCEDACIKLDQAIEAVKGEK